MADEKLNVSPEENPQPSLFDAGPEGAPAQDAPAPETPAPEPPAPENIPEQAAVDAPAQDAPAGVPGEVSVSADQIEKLMAEQRAAGRAEVEKNVSDSKPTVVHNLSFPAILLLKEQKEESVSECTLQP